MDNRKTGTLAMKTDVEDTAESQSAKDSPQLIEARKDKGENIFVAFTGSSSYLNLDV